jgi:ParB family chromosome partitioning protein
VENRISEGHARALLALGTPQAQAAALQVILERDLTVRQTEELVRRLSGKQPYPQQVKGPPSPEVTALEERLRTRLGTRVTLNPRRRGGTLVIHHYPTKISNALVEQILGMNSNTCGCQIDPQI